MLCHHLKTWRLGGSEGEPRLQWVFFFYSVFAESTILWVLILLQKSHGKKYALVLQAKKKLWETPCVWLILSEGQVSSCDQSGPGFTLPPLINIGCATFLGSFLETEQPEMLLLSPMALFFQLGYSNERCNWDCRVAKILEQHEVMWH